MMVKEDVRKIFAGSRPRILTLDLFSFLFYLQPKRLEASKFCVGDISAFSAETGALG